MRRENNNNENNTRRNEDLKGKGGSRLKHYNVDGYVPLRLRNFDEKKKTVAAAKRTAKKGW